MDQILNYNLGGNKVLDYLIAIGIYAVIILAIRLFRKVLLSKLKKWSEKTTSSLDDVLIGLVEKSVLPILNVLAITSSLQYLTLNPRVSKIIHIGLAVAITFFVLRLISNIIRHILSAYIRRQEGGEEKLKQVRGIMIVINIVIWLLGIVFLLDNLGYDITAVVAGLGIGGIAIALASQAILGDLFSYFVIFFDRPFEVGDFIVLDDKNGIIDKVGIKTTRIRTLSGEQLVVSNTDLTNSRIHNFKKMERRRVVFRIGVVYHTTAEQIEMIPQIIKKIIDNKEDATYDRSHFVACGNFSLDFETVYFIEGPEYNRFADIHQAVLLEMFKEFKALNIEFAFPTQTLHVQGTLNRESPTLEANRE